MKNYSYLLALTFGLMQISTAQANLMSYSTPQPKAASIEVPESRPALKAMIGANAMLVNEFRQTVDRINNQPDMKSAPKSRADFTNLYDLLKRSYTPIMSNELVDQSTKDAVRKESKDLAETYQQTLKKLKK